MKKRLMAICCMPFVMTTHPSTNNNPLSRSVPSMAHRIIAPQLGQAIPEGIFHNKSIQPKLSRSHSEISISILNKEQSSNNQLHKSSTPNLAFQEFTLDMSEKSRKLKAFLVIYLAQRKQQSAVQNTKLKENEHDRLLTKVFSVPSLSDIIVSDIDLNNPQKRALELLKKVCSKEDIALLIADHAAKQGIIGIENAERLTKIKTEIDTINQTIQKEFFTA